MARRTSRRSRSASFKKAVCRHTRSELGISPEYFDRGEKEEALVFLSQKVGECTPKGEKPAHARPTYIKRSHPSAPLAWVTYMVAPVHGRSRTWSLPPCKAFLNEGWRRIRLQPYIRTFVKPSIRLRSLMEFAGRGPIVLSSSRLALPIGSARPWSYLACHHF